MAQDRGSGAFYCWNCGADIEKGKRKCPHCGATYRGENRYTGNEKLPDIGFSDRANDPFFKKHKRKNVTAGLIWGVGLAVLIPGALLLFGGVERNAEGFTVAAVVAGVILLLMAIFLLRGYAKRPEIWEGTVTDKTEEHRTTHKRVHDSNERYVTEEHTYYTIVYTLTDGRVKKEIAMDDGGKYTYFNIGEYVRKYNTSEVKYTEKYDKSKEAELFCAGCGHLNDARDNYCEFCGAPMLK